MCLQTGPLCVNGEGAHCALSHQCACAKFEMDLGLKISVVHVSLITQLEYRLFQWNGLWNFMYSRQHLCSSCFHPFPLCQTSDFYTAGKDIDMYRTASIELIKYASDLWPLRFRRGCMNADPMQGRAGYEWVTR